MSYKPVTNQLPNLRADLSRIRHPSVELRSLHTALQGLEGCAPTSGTGRCFHAFLPYCVATSGVLIHINTVWNVWKICAGMHVCMHVCTYVCMYVRTYVCTHVRIYICTYVCKYVCTYVRMYVCMYVCMHVCMYVCTYVRTCAQSLQKSLIKVATLIKWSGGLPKIMVLETLIKWSGILARSLN